MNPEQRLDNKEFSNINEENEKQIDIKHLFFKYIYYWKWFVLSMFLTISLAYVYLRYKTPAYNIKTSILIKDEKKGIGAGTLMKELDLFNSNKVVDNEIEIIKSYTIIGKVIKNLNLNISYYAKKTFKNQDLYGESPINVEIIEEGEFIYKKPLLIEVSEDKSHFLLEKKGLPFNKKIKTSFGIIKVTLTGKEITDDTYIVKATPIEYIIQGLIGRIKVEPSSKTSSVLVISMNDPVPQKAKDILNNLVQEYNYAAIDDKNRVSAKTLIFIEERLKLISADLEMVEKSVQDFKSRERITDISSESKIFLEGVQSNDLKLNQVKIQQSVLSSIEEYVINKESRPGTVPATIGINDPTLISLINKLSELELQRDRNIRMVNANNPLSLVITEQIKNIKANIYENVKSIKKNLNLTAEQIQLQNLEMEGIIRKIPGKERELVDISRQQMIKNKLFLFLLEKREETALSFAAAVSDSRIIDDAISSIAPISPNRRNVFLFFILVGLTVPVAVLYIIELLNDKIRGRFDIEKYTRAPIIGEISHSEHGDVNSLVVMENERSVVSEQIRSIRTNLSFSSLGKEYKTILFTSSISGEGKSFVSLNLAASLAITGKKTVILEFDLRKPKIQASLGMDKAAGLSNYLIGKATLDEVIRPIPNVNNFYIISCGPIPPNPVELLLSEKLDELFEELKKEFDYIIIDAPPIGIVTDAQILGKKADVTLYVLRHEHTPKDRVKMVNNIYINNKFNNMNLIFNGIKLGGKYGYGYGGYGSGYGYGYSYGYGYYSEDKKKKK